MGRTITLWIATILLLGLLSGLVLAKDGKGGRANSAKMPKGWYTKSVALVVGIDNYKNKWQPLEKAVFNAKQMETELKRQGFQVTTLLDEQATKSEILRQLATVLPKEVGPNDRFVFYFAGQSQDERQGEGRDIVSYLIPADGSREFGDLWFSYLSLPEVRTALKKYRARHVLAIFDACFLDLLPIKRPFGPCDSMESCLPKQGLMLINSGFGVGHCQEGLFTSAVLTALQGDADKDRDGYVTFREMESYAQWLVGSANLRQTPGGEVWIGDGQMLFNHR
ncbi:MAG: caspase family protein [Myxococcales bacterium]|nr:MAG: caspase family protein [Myxococcales bacterium]